MKAERSFMFLTTENTENTEDYPAFLLFSVFSVVKKLLSSG